MKILVDENLPRSLLQDLNDIGHEAISVKDCVIRGSPDETVYSYAQEKNAVILTRDRGFGNIWRFPLGHHHGIIVINLPNEMAATRVKTTIISKLQTLSPEDIRGNVVIIEPVKIRIRKH